jgi:hypothetical protein
MEIEETTNLLPVSKYAWENYPGAPSDWCGYEGLFSNLEEVDKFITGINKITS